MAIEYTKILEKYISEGLSEIEDITIRETLRKLIAHEIDILEKEKARYKEEMEIFEKKYSLQSEEFLAKFNSGAIGDDQAYFEWYACIDSYKRIEKRQRFLVYSLK